MVTRSCKVCDNWQYSGGKEAIEMAKMSLEKKRLAARVTVTLVSTVGLLIQIHSISQEYFAYNTHTRMKILFPETVIAPNLAICFPFNELIHPVHKTRRNKSTNKNRPRVKLIELQDDLPDLTAGQVFNLTPAVDINLIERCTWSHDKLYTKNSLKKQQCLHKPFKVTKLTTGEWICYEVRLLGKEFILDRLFDVPLTRGLIFSVTLNKTIFSSVSRSLITLFNGDTPSMSIRYATKVVRHSPGEQENELSGIDVTSFRRFFTKLPLPYRDGCTAIILPKHWCLRKCIFKNSLETLSRVPSSTMFSDNPELFHRYGGNFSHVRFVKFSEMMNETITQQMDMLRNKCRQQCASSGFHCEYSFLITQATAVGPGGFDSMAFSVYAQSREDTFLTDEAAMTCSEFIVLLLSSLGVWFGFSFISIEPIQLISRARKCCLVSMKTLLSSDFTSTCHIRSKRKEKISPCNGHSVDKHHATVEVNANTTKESSDTSFHSLPPVCVE